ncbi:hypothetical protein TNCV_3836721 [Trichonephila clavipes]|nr:hypothetical protein TNCV_3836721 [Trichonephila clavipes]
MNLNQNAAGFDLNQGCQTQRLTWVEQTRFNFRWSAKKVETYRNFGERSQNDGSGNTGGAKRCTCVTAVHWFETENREMRENEQMINLKFCFKLGKTPKEIYTMLVRAYEDQALSMKCMYKWFTRFREGQESVSATPVAKGRCPPSVTKALRK